MLKVGISAIIKASEMGEKLLIGFPVSSISEPVGQAGGVYNVAQLSSTTGSLKVSNNFNFPYFTRLSPSTENFATPIYETLKFYINTQGPIWSDVAIIASSDEFGISLSEAFVELGKDDINVVLFRQFLQTSVTGTPNYEIELEEIKNSGVRIIMAFIVEPWSDFIITADKLGLVDEHHVWFTSDYTVGEKPFTEKAANLSRGLIAPFRYIPITDQLIQFIDRWRQLDPIKYPGAGPNFTPSAFTFTQYDTYITLGKAIDIILKNSAEYNIGQDQDDLSNISGDIWTEIIRNITFDGISGKINFDDHGDLVIDYSILFYKPGNSPSPWVETAIYDSFNHEYQFTNEIIWFDNTTNIPDLDIREPFYYWSCHKKEKLYDETGKTVYLHSPDGSDIDDIDSDYYCDQFIDCKNLSDEGFSCSSSNFIILFIVFGIITGLLICFSFALIIFVFIYGIIFKYRRLRVSSPSFLILMLISIIIGYSSIFAWFGKPHPVACGFQPWLLGLSVLSMFIALTVKSFRIWRIFNFPLEKVNISNFELFILWFICIIPAIIILILWSIISTPTAKLIEQDDKDHYVCTTGGFTGYPGGYIFFSIFTAYCAIILFLGAILCILIRNVPSQFNESKLMAISIYNLVFLSVVIVPVYMVLISYEPFIAWIIRTCAILYAFTATLVLQFFPKIIGIVFIDRCKNVRVFRSALQKPSSGSSPNSPNSQVSSSEFVSTVETSDSKI